jgi:hypothetical protein
MIPCTKRSLMVSRACSPCKRAIETSHEGAEPTKQTNQQHRLSVQAKGGCLMQQAPHDSQLVERLAEMQQVQTMLRHQV